MSPHWMGCPHPFRSPRAAGASRPRKRVLRLSATAVRAELLEGRVLLSTYVVTNLNDAGPGSLRDAITQANQGPGVDAIRFSRKLAGTIVLSSGKLQISDALRISGPGATAVTVSGNHQSAVFEVDANVTAAISGLTVADGHAAFGFAGGGILNKGVLTVADSNLSGNFATTGGGIENSITGTLSVDDCTFSGDFGTFGGGGIENEGSLAVADSTFTGNTGGIVNGSGGGIENQGAATVADSTFSGNSGFGAGIGNPAGTLNVARCRFANNHGSDGGGLLNDGTTTVAGSTFTGNSATFSGGGIRNDGSLTLTDSMLSGNSARTGGGIASNGTIAITAGLFAGNSASQGGGIDIGNGTASLYNTIVAVNSAKQGGGIEVENGAATLYNAIIAANSGGGIDCENGTATLYNAVVVGNRPAPSS